MRDLLERRVLLEQLDRLLENTRRGEGHLALVTGEAGIGKTSIVEAFCRSTGAEVMWGTCDSIVPPRPFAPLVDFAASSPGLRDALDDGDRDRIIDAFLAWAYAEPGRVMVFEDMHWADAASLDLLRVIAPRLRRLGVLVIVSYRDNEVEYDHPLQLALELFPADIITLMPVPPLTIAGVSTLTEGTDLDPDHLHALTGGNPFFVTELMASGSTGVPPTVRRAVQVRFARLSFEARRLAAAASVLPVPVETRVLRMMTREGMEAIDECLQRGFLRSERGRISFRHELTRWAVSATLDADEAAEWHLQALRALERSPAVDPAHAAYHAVAAGDVDAVLRWSASAAERAEALGAHREAAGHLATVIALESYLDDRARAQLLEAHARAAVAADDLPSALTSQREAIDIWSRLEETTRQGVALSDQSFLEWLAGEGPNAIASSEQAVHLLEVAAPGSRELAMAYAVLAQRHAVAGNDAESLEQGRQALRLGEALGDEEVLEHAGTTMAAIEIYSGDERGWSWLEECAAQATTAGRTEGSIRALVNLVEAAQDHYRLKAARRYARIALASLPGHGIGLYSDLLAIRLAEIDLETGRWSRAEERVSALAVDRSVAAIIRARALVVLGRLRARQGRGDPWEALDQAASLLPPTEVQDLRIVHAARAEAAFLAGDAHRARMEAEEGLVASHVPTAPPAWWAELAFWSWKSGSDLELPSDGPFGVHRSGRPREAAAAWEEIGCPYYQAVALADSSLDHDLDHALSLFLDMGARPMARLVAEELRRRGVRRIRRGPRPSTRDNFASLTNRQLEVLRLVADGLSNRAIADRLVISIKTVDHHVSAILNRLGVSSRAEAAFRLSAQDGETAAQYG